MADAKEFVYGPSYEEMLYPDRIPEDVRARALRAAEEDLLDPVNLYNITWKDPEGRVHYVVLDKALTGVDANIVVLYAANFPTGSHKVGATYSVAMEKQMLGEIIPGEHRLVWPSTGNYGIGGAWVGPRMGYESLVILPELMSQERFERIEQFGASYIKTPGCESNVWEIYQKCMELAKAPEVRVLNQFEIMANYRFHYYVTGHSAEEVVRELEQEGVGDGKVAAFVSAMGSEADLQGLPYCRTGAHPVSDTLRERLRRARHPRHRRQARDLDTQLLEHGCPDVHRRHNGYGGHDIQGIGDKHVTWIHNCLNMDALMCIDDIESKKGLQLITEPGGKEYLATEAGVPEEHVEKISKTLGISSIGQRGYGGDRRH